MLAGRSLHQKKQVTKFREAWPSFAQFCGQNVRRYLFLQLYRIKSFHQVWVLASFTKAQSLHSSCLTRERINLNYQAIYTAIAVGDIETHV